LTGITGLLHWGKRGTQCRTTRNAQMAPQHVFLAICDPTTGFQYLYAAYFENGDVQRATAKLRLAFTRPWTAREGVEVAALACFLFPRSADGSENDQSMCKCMMPACLISLRHPLWLLMSCAWVLPKAPRPGWLTRGEWASLQ